MPRLITDRQQDARFARAWAAFAREDAAASAPAGLEARVLQAARTAIAERRRAEAERQRRRWMAGTSAIAASLLAAAAWSLSALTPPAVTDAATPTRAAAAPAGADAGTAGTAAGETASMSPAPGAPMTNVEAGRILATPPHALLASRPLFDAADTGVVGIRGVPRARAWHAPIVDPAPYARTPSATAARTGSGPEPLAAPAAAPEAWATREATPLFDPDTAEPVAPAPLAEQKSGVVPRDIPPPQPKP